MKALKGALAIIALAVIVFFTVRGEMQIHSHPGKCQGLVGKMVMPNCK